MSVAVLKIDKSGQPLRWVSREQAAHLVCNDKVLWSFGDDQIKMRGGISRSGSRTVLHLSPIIAVDGAVSRHPVRIPLKNKYLFRRDDYRCLYCGHSFDHASLTRDHVTPKSKGGRDTFHNLVSCCIPCNQRKRDRTPSQANMPLLAVPYEPTFSEFLYLQNRRILGDQMEFLKKGFHNLSAQ